MIWRCWGKILVTMGCPKYKKGLFVTLNVSNIHYGLAEKM